MLYHSVDNRGTTSEVKYRPVSGPRGDATAAWRRADMAAALAAWTPLATLQGLRPWKLKLKRPMILQ
eukprot:1674357-Pleurochrysis_carterae.AAC.1